MKFWTIQDKRVLEIIQKQGFYLPDFARSTYLEKCEGLDELYSVILHSFNQINGLNLKGVVFAFTKCEEYWIKPIETFQEFQEFIKIKQPVIASLWRELSNENSVVMELDYEDNFNPIYIDINDFQFLMPPIMVLFPYTEESISRILKDIKMGQITVSELPSNVIQAHLPYIAKANVTNIYPIFEV